MQTSESDGKTEDKEQLKKLREESSQIKVIFVIMILVLIAIVFPLFKIAHYNFRSADDFEFSKCGEPVWEETHSVIKVLTEEAAYVKDLYFAWQGTYFDLWLSMSLLGIFGKNAYYMGTYLSLGGFLLAELLLLMIILVRVLKADIFRAGIVSMSCLSMQILMTPVPSQGYFWFCGAIRYTFMHALALLLLSVLLLIYQTYSIKKVVVLECLAVLLTVAIGGGNYITALLMLILYCLSVIWTVIRKHPYRWLYIGNTILFFVAFLINVLAPGNRIRQQSSGVEHMSAALAILRSLKEAAVYVNLNTFLPCMILGMLLLPLYINIVRKRDYRYPWPVVISLLSFGVFAAQFTPNLYALRSIGEGRVQNLYRLNFYLLLFGNELYWTGWAVRRWFNQNTKSIDQNKKCCYLLPGWLTGGIFLCMALYLWSNNTLTSLSALQSLRYGYAEVYYQENQERLAILEDEEVDIAYLKPFTYTPYVLFFNDIQEKPGNWINWSIAAFYGKDAVWLLE